MNALERGQGQCSFSGRAAHPARPPNNRQYGSGRQQLLTIPQLISRMTASPSGVHYSAPSSPSYTQRSAVAEKMADTSMAPLPLSTYTSRHRPTVNQWLEACVKDAVRNLDEAPFLQLYLSGENGQPDRTERHTVTPTVVQTPQLWTCIAEHLAQAAPEVLMLVHPLDMRLDSPKTKQRIVQGRQGGLSDVLTGMTAHSRHKLHARQTLESLMNSGLASAQFSGRVGEDCCDDEVYNQVVPFPLRGKSSHRKRLEEEMNANIKFWGVVVQSQVPSEAQGCYVLKTVHSVNPTDCQCTHFTLTRVSHGEPLADQLAQAWLV